MRRSWCVGSASIRVCSCSTRSASSCRRSGLAIPGLVCARAAALVAQFSRAARYAVCVGVVRAAGTGELLDREVLVVALEHSPRDAREQLVTVRRSVSVGANSRAPRA